MRQMFGWSSTGAAALTTAFLAVLIGTGAQAGDVVAPQDLDSGIHGQDCGGVGETCAHISGYIKAGSDSFARDPDGQRSRLVAPPSATADALNRGITFFEVGPNDSAR
jgi:hypothetical protein